LLKKAMLNKSKIFLYCDRAIIVLLSLLIFCLPFSKAGIESFLWPAFFLFILKRALGYRADSLWGMLPKTGLNKALGVFILINAVSVIFSSHFGLSMRGFFGKELKFIAVYFMLVETINSRVRLKYILIAIISSVVLIIFDAGVQLYRGVDFLRGYTLDTFSASFSNSAGFAAWLIVIIPLFIGLIASDIIPNKKLKILLSVSVVIQIFYLSRTYSRGAWLGFIIAAMIMLYCFFRNSTLKGKFLFLLIFLSLLSGYLFIPPSLVVNTKEAIKKKLMFDQTISERIKLALNTKEGSVSIRFGLWREALMISRDYPLTGCGLNTYSVTARQYKSFDDGGTYPHNSYLQMAAETGFFGVFAFIWILFGFFKTLLRYFNRMRDYLALGLLSGILAFLIHAFFDVHLYSLQLAVLFWYMLGLAIAVVNLNNKERYIYEK